MKRSLVRLASAVVLGVSTAASAPGPGREIALCTAPGNQVNVVATSDGRGGAFVAWADSRRGEFDVYAAHLLPSGGVDPAWPAQGLPLCLAPGDQAAPAIVTDGQGGTIVAWFDQRGGTDHDVYAQRVDGRGRVRWIENGIALCTAPGHQHGVALAEDGAAGAIVTWFDHRDGPDADIYAQHVTASGTVDPRWRANGMPVCAAPAGQYFPRPVPDQKGGAIIAWYDHRAGQYDIYAQHLLASGQVDATWPSDGLALCTAPKDQRRPVAVTDGRGGAIVVWEDMRDDPGRDLYAHHVQPGGRDPDWPANGLAVCAERGGQRDAALMADGAGGAFVAWQDARNDGGDIFTQHLTSAGQLDPAWPVGGIAVARADNEQGTPAIGDDGSRGVLVAWQDMRDGEQYDVRATRVSGRGELEAVAGEDGREVCAAPGNQLRPVIAAVGHGRALLVWEDARRGETDLYASWWQEGASRSARKPRSAPP